MQQQQTTAIPDVIRTEAQARGWSLTGAYTDEGKALRFWHCSNGMMIAWARNVSRYIVRRIGS